MGSTVEFHSAMKKKIMLFPGKWMQLNMNILSEVSKKQKKNIACFFLICGFRLLYRHINTLSVCMFLRMT